MPNVDALAPLRLGSIRTFSGAVDGNLYSHNPLPVAGMVKSALDRVIAQMGNRDRSRSLSARAAISFKECAFLFPVATVPCRLLRQTKIRQLGRPELEAWGQSW